MSGSDGAGAFGMGDGELLAIDLPPGPAWVDVIHRCWSEGVPFLPMDVRWSEAERRRVIDRARPTAMLEGTGEVTVFGGATPAEPGAGVVLATSGTGGDPRLAEISRHAVEAAVRGSAGALDEGPSPAGWLCCLTPAHAGGLLVLLRAELSGSPVVVHERFDVAAVGRALGADAPVAVSVVPAMLTRLATWNGELGGATILVGGGAVDAATARAIRDRGARVVQTYGMTETCGGVVYDGVPFEGTRVRIASGPRPMIEVLGPTLCDGYRGDPGATGAAFDSRGWFRTGDLGAIGEEGRLSVWGRADDAIRTGGETVWPDEVESILRAHPGVDDAAVAGRPHPAWGEEVVAFLVPADPADAPGLDEVKGWVRDRAAPFKAPRRVAIVDAIPRTSSGKVRRGRLPP